MARRTVPTNRGLSRKTAARALSGSARPQAHQASPSHLGPRAAAIALAGSSSIHRIITRCSGRLLLIGSVVKATHYEDTNALFRQHFLGFQRYDAERGIAGSIEDFTKRYTLEQQLSKRTARLTHSLRSEEMVSLADPDNYTDWKDLSFRWNALI